MKAPSEGRPILRANSIRRLGCAAAGLMLLMAGPVSAGMPPEAQTAVSRGIKAAKQEHDYLRAIRDFQEARALVPVAPDAPEIFLNLGLAEAQLPGRELRAVGWLAAYFSASRNAANAPAVREEIGMLRARNRSNLLRLIRTVQKAADSARFQSPWFEVLDRVELARAQSATGDVAGAQEVFARELGVANQIQHAPGKSFALSAIAEAESAAAVGQAAVGDIAGAQKYFAAALTTADLIEDTVLAQKGYTRAHIAKQQFAAGDIVGALETTELIDDAVPRNFALEYLSSALAEAGLVRIPDPAVSPPTTEPAPAAEGIQTMADEVFGHMAATKDYRDLQMAATLMTQQVQIGWARSDESTVLVLRLNLLRADAAATSIVAAPGGRALQYSIGGTKVVDTGIVAAELERSAAYRSTIADAIAANNLFATLPPETRTQPPLGRFLRWGNLINVASPTARSTVTLANWLGRLDAADPEQTCALNTPPFLDLAASLQSLVLSTDPQKSFEAPAAVIEKIASAQAWIDQMVNEATQQARDQTNQDAAEQRVKTGDLAGAQAATDLIRDPAERAEAQSAIDQARGELAFTQAKAGEFDAARQTAGLIQAENRAGQTESYGRIACLGLAQALARVKAGDLAAALGTTRLIQDSYFLSGAAAMLNGQAWAAIALAQVKADDLAAAQQSLGLAQKAGERCRDVDTEKTVQSGVDLAQAALADAQIQAGDLAGAQATIDQMRPEADSPQDKTRNSLVAAQVGSGDLAGAQATADAIQDEDWKKKAEDLLATAKPPAPTEEEKP